MAPEDVPHFIDNASPSAADVFAQHSQPSHLLVGSRRDIYLPESADRLALQKAIPVDPQHFTQGSRIATIGFSPFAFFWLNENYLVTTVVSQHPDEPVVKAADFNHSDE